MIDDAIDLDPADRATVLELLHRHVPDCEVRAYGSRVTWRARPYSDLDLAVVGSDALGPLALMELREALTNARLPFFVDVLEWEALPDSFCREIERKYAVLQEARVVDGWRDVAVGDIAHIVGGGTPSTKRPEFFGGHVPWLTPKDLSVPHGRYVTRGNRSLTEQGLHQSSATLVPERTVLLTTRAPVGYVALAAQPISTNQGFRNLVVRDGHWPEFVYYWLLANTAELERHASGSTFRELSGSVLKLIRMRVPSKDEQRRIADVLGALDDRIELNRRMCATLEEMASALFKSWFVDFEPMRAKMEGRWREGESLLGLPAHLYDLFPDSLVDSELGPIPIGWRACRLDDVADHLRETIDPRRSPDQEYALYSIPALDSGKSPELAQGHAILSNKCVVHPGTVLLSRLNPDIDRVWLIGAEIGEPAIASTEFAVLRPKPPVHPSFLYCYLRSDQYRNALVGLVTGTSKSHQRVRPQALAATTLLMPNEKTLAAFSSIASVWLGQVLVLRSTSQSLTALRDVLLPKLISGEVRLPDAAGVTDC